MKSWIWYLFYLLSIIYSFSVEWGQRTVSTCLKQNHLQYVYAAYCLRRGGWFYRQCQIYDYILLRYDKKFVIVSSKQGCKNEQCYKSTELYKSKRNSDYSTVYWWHLDDFDFNVINKYPVGLWIFPTMIFRSSLILASFKHLQVRYQNSTQVCQNVWPYIVRWHYNRITFLQNPLNRHPYSSPMRARHECLLWVEFKVWYKFCVICEVFFVISWYMAPDGI